MTRWPPVWMELANAFPNRLLGLAVLAAVGLAAPRPATADDEPPLTVDDEAALRSRLAARVALVSVEAESDPLLDPQSRSRDFGQAILLRRGNGREDLLTSAALAAEGRRVEVSGVRGDGAVAAAVVAHDEARGLATIDHRPPDLSTTQAAPAESCATGVPLFAIATAGDQLVLARTAVGPEAGPGLPGMVVVAMSAVGGTPFFDASGRAVAVAVRRLASSAAHGRATVLAALVCDPAPGPPEARGPDDAQVRRRR